MKKIILATLLSLAFIPAAQAQTQAQTNAKPVHFFAGAGITVGGDNLATAYYTNGTQSKISAGTGLALIGGIDYRFHPDFSAQASVGYHARFTPAASNGDASFSRMPIELLGYYHVNDQWRVGTGARFVNSTKLSSSGVASYLDKEFKNTQGLVVEAEYLGNSNLGIKVRLVNESYQAVGSSKSYSGSHLGVIATYYF